jgi:hypothetical protein
MSLAKSRDISKKLLSTARPSIANLRKLTTPIQNHWYFTSSSKVGYKATNLFFVNIVYIFNVATFKLGFLKAKLSDMLSTGKLFEKSRILEKFSIMVQMAS